ncbi:thioredoxin fold domain-containing protein [bacterium]|nr:thioredoxin fold domain-containing protein [bacterium]
MRRMLAVTALIGLSLAADASTLSWRNDPGPGPLVAADQQRPSLLYFTASWCAPCRLVEREVLEHPDGQAELAHFDLIRIDLDSEAGQRLSDRFRVATVPTFVVLDASGEEIDRTRGYRSRRLLLRDLERCRLGRGTRGDLERRLSERPDDAALQVALGLRYVERIELDTAERLLASGLGDLAALGDTLVGEGGRALATLHRQRGEVDRAIAVLDRVLADRPDHLYARATWQLLATCHADRGDPLAEARALRGAARVAPPRPPSLLAFAEAAARADWSLTEAEAAAREAIELTGGDDPAAKAALAAVLRRQQRFPEALKWIRRAVAQAPDDTRWHERWEGIRAAAVRGR